MKSHILLFALLTSFFSVQSQVSCTVVNWCTNQSTNLSIGLSGEIYTWESSIDSLNWSPLNDSDSIYAASVSDNSAYFRVTVDNDSMLCWLLQPISIAINATANTLCAGDTSQIMLTTTNCIGCTYNWFVDNNPDEANESVFTFNPSISLTAATGYEISASITYTESDSSCSITVNDSLFVNPLPSFNLSTSNACLNDSVIVSINPPIANANYLWNGVVYESLNFSPPTNEVGEFPVILQLSDNNGCNRIDTSTYLVFSLPFGSISGDFNACAGDTIYLSVASDATEFDWSVNGSDFTEVSNQLSYSSLVSADYNVSVIITDTNNCRDSIQQNIEFYAIPTVSILGADTLCLGDSIALTSDIFSESMVTSSWPDMSEGLTFTYIGTEAGIFAINLLATSAQGCSASDTVNLLVNAPPTFSYGGDTSPCGNSTFELFADNPTLEYEWSLTDSLVISDSTTINYTATFEPTFFQLVGTDPNTRCSTRLDISGQALTGPLSTLPSLSEFCEGETILVVDTSGLNLQWFVPALSLGNYTSEGSSFSAIAGVGIFEVYATLIDTVEDCTSLDTIVVSVYENPMFNAEISQITCENQPLELLISDVSVASSSVTDYTISWFNSDSIISILNPLIENSPTAGIYSVFVEVIEMQHNCSTTDTLEVSITSGPIFFHNEAVPNCLGESVFLNIDSTNVADYTTYWTFEGTGSEGNTATYILSDSTTIYNISVTNNATGCVSDSSYSIAALTLPLFSEIVLLTPGLLSTQAENYNGFTWGYTSAATGVEIVLATSENYAYFNIFDPANNYYWVEYGNSNGCVLRVYYNNPILDVNQELGPSLKAYPVPASNQLTIECSSFNERMVTYSIVGLTGQIIETGNISTVGSTITLDISSFSPGPYYLQLQCDSMVTTIPFSKITL